MTRLIAKRRRPWSVALIDALEERVLMSAVPLPHGMPAHAALRSDLHHASPSARATARWDWFANTYWYVPTPNTPALVFEPGSETVAPILDQTVFHITGYREGYFWGIAATQLGSNAPTYSSLVGSVTPEDRVLLNFTPMGDSSIATITEGIGQMRLKGRQWTMENQMFTTPSSSAQLGHWAYMVQTRPGQPSWSALPVAGVSVPQFLSQSPSPGPHPIA